MMLRSLGFGAALALAADAFLVPPTVSIDSINTDNAVGFFGVEPFGQLIKLDSPSCLRDGGVWADGEGVCSLLLNFTASAEQFQINEVTFYPPAFGHESTFTGIPSDFLTRQIFVRQIPSDVSIAEVLGHPDDYDSPSLALTSYGFKVEAATTVSETGDEIIPMSFQVYAVGGKAIDVPNVQLHVLKDKDGNLMILNVATEPSTAAPGKPEDKVCHDWPLLCQWRDAFSSKLSGIKDGIRKGCHKAGIGVRPPHNLHHGPHSHHDGAGPRPHYHHHDGGHSLAHFIVRICALVMMGFVLAACMYFVGMLLGAVVAMVVIAVMRLCGFRRGYASVAQDEQDAVVKEESIEIVHEEEPLPVYEEAPIYSEKEVV